MLDAAVNTLVLPPVHLRDADGAVRSLAAEISTQLRAVAGEVDEGWGAGEASTWVGQARGLRTAVRRAHDAVCGPGKRAVEPRRRTVAAFGTPLAGPDVVERLERLGVGGPSVSPAR